MINKITFLENAIRRYKRAVARRCNVSNPETHAFTYICNYIRDFEQCLVPNAEFSVISSVENLVGVMRNLLEHHDVTYYLSDLVFYDTLETFCLVNVDWKYAILPPNKLSPSTLLAKYEETQASKDHIAFLEKVCRVEQEESEYEGVEFEDAILPSKERFDCLPIYFEMHLELLYNFDVDLVVDFPVAHGRLLKMPTPSTAEYDFEEE